MRECPNCQTALPEGADSCEACGAALEEERLYACPRCGERTPDAAVCLACGKLHLEQSCTRHPDRAAEGRCVICGTPLCGRCRTPDRYAFLCEAHRNVAVFEGWAQVYSTKNEFEAQLLCENLGAEGFPAQLFSQKDRIFSVDLGELSIVRVLVPAREFEKAFAVVRDHMDTGGEVVFACPSCGEAYDPGEGTCSSCGASLV